MSLSSEVVGSTVRDFCMLERNFLAHFKLVLLLTLLSASALLGTRLSGPSGEKERLGGASLPAAIIQVLAALTTIAAAIWEYHSGVEDLLRVRAFLAVTRGHFLIMVLVTMMIVGTTVLYIARSAS